MTSMPWNLTAYLPVRWHCARTRAPSKAIDTTLPTTLYQFKGERP